MFRSKRSSTALFAMAFVVLACAALIGLDLGRTWQAREVQKREASVAVANMAFALAQHADDTFKEADTVLVGLLERLKLDGVSPPVLARLHQLLIMHTKELAQLDGLYIYDSQGRYLVNSRPEIDPRLRNSDRDYFVFHRDHPGTTPFVGAPVRSRATGQWVATISRRINAADGSFGGVVLATIDMGYFQRYYDSFDIGKAGAIVLALNGGTMVVRRPLREEAIGKSMANGELFRNHASFKSSGVAVIKSAQDGVLRINGYRHLRAYPLFVAVALSCDEVLTQWRADAFMHTLGVLILVCGFGLMGRRMVSQIDQRAAAEKEANAARTQVEQLNQTLARLAMQDGMTTLANRRSFDAMLLREMSRAARSGNTLSLIMIDVDRFKLYNDMYGHLAGDECLRKIGQAILAGERRSGDMAARYGGEEFALILPDCDTAGAATIAEQIRLAVRELNITHAGSPVGVVTVSLGVGSLALIRRGTDVKELVGAADQALYRAKFEGRDRVGT